MMEKMDRYRDEMDQYMNERDTADYTGLSQQTLRNYRATGRGPAYSKIGKAVRYLV